ncbi:MAG: GTP 3',8-cyclase MoaA [Candidatus Aminicenantes bacterium]|nr:GTP 3',8-cyclase MoaA [Candidatus Aminicenantes bacterium]
MKDKFGRGVDHLRISVTQRCNLSCTYCHHEGESNPGAELSPKQIRESVEVFSEMGIRKVKITGGEPLVRNDILEIVENISSIDGIEEVSMTTNGLLLEKLAASLKRAGLSRINIGCDSLSSVLPKNIQKIKKGLAAVREASLEPIKINMVVLKGINNEEIEKMIDFAQDNHVILQLIELINVDNAYYQKYYFSLDGVELELEKKARQIQTRKMQARKQYLLDGVVVEIVRPNKEGFCLKCPKIRLTSDGKIKPCLLRQDNLTVFENRDSIIKAFGERCIHAHD